MGCKEFDCGIAMSVRMGTARLTFSSAWANCHRTNRSLGLLEQSARNRPVNAVEVPCEARYLRAAHVAEVIAVTIERAVLSSGVSSTVSASDVYLQSWFLAGPMVRASRFVQTPLLYRLSPEDGWGTGR